MADIIKAKRDTIEQARKAEVAEQSAVEIQKIAGHLKASIEADVDAIIDARQQANEILLSVDFPRMERDSVRFLEDGTASAVRSLRNHIRILIPRGLDQGADVWREDFPAFTILGSHRAAC